MSSHVRPSRHADSSGPPPGGGSGPLSVAEAGRVTSTLHAIQPPMAAQTALPHGVACVDPSAVEVGADRVGLWCGSEDRRVGGDGGSAPSRGRPRRRCCSPDHPPRQRSAWITRAGEPAAVLSASGSPDLRSAAMLATAVTTRSSVLFVASFGDSPGVGGSRLLSRNIDKRRPVCRLLLSLVLGRARG